MKEVKLPSGAILKITLSPFAISKALYQALLKEARGVPLGKDLSVSELYKNIFCMSFSSPEIEKWVWECFKRCTYNNGNGDLKIDENTFEPSEAREDYMSACIEVAKENVAPFAKSLYAEYQRALAMIGEGQA